MKQQVSHTVKAGYFHLKSIGRVRRHLNTKTCSKVINSTVTVRQDYQNALLAGCHQSILQPLQRLQNTAARMLARSPLHNHITPVLKGLHWLPVQQRCDFKLLVLIHDALYNKDALAYLKDLFRRY